MNRDLVLIAQDSELIQTFEKALTAAKTSLRSCGTIEQGIDEIGQHGAGVVVVAYAECGDNLSSALHALRAVARTAPIYVVPAQDHEIPSDVPIWFEVLAPPVRIETVRWLVDAVIWERPSRLFKLYLTGRGRYAQSCAHRVRTMLDSAMQGQFELEVIDILTQPNRARFDEVRATPTLVRMGSEPRQQLVGVDEARIERLWDPAEVRW